MSTRRERAKAQRRHGDTTICHVSDAPQVNRQQMVELGKFFYDLAKLVFGAVILTGFIDFKLEKIPSIVEGVAVIVVFDIAGWLLIKRGNLKRKQV
jgi:hypothetical protein